MGIFTRNDGEKAYVVSEQDDVSSEPELVAPAAPAREPEWDFKHETLNHIADEYLADEERQTAKLRESLQNATNFGQYATTVVRAHNALATAAANFSYSVDGFDEINGYEYESSMAHMVASTMERTAGDKVIEVALDVIEEQSSSERELSEGIYAPGESETAVVDKYAAVLLTSMATQRSTIERLAKNDMLDNYLANLDQRDYGTQSSIVFALGNSLEDMTNTTGDFIGKYSQRMPVTGEQSMLSMYSPAITDKPLFGEHADEFVQMYMTDDYSGLSDLVVNEANSIETSNRWSFYGADEPEHIGETFDHQTERLMDQMSFTARRELVAQTVKHALEAKQLDLTPEAYEKLNELNNESFYPDNFDQEDTYLRDSDRDIRGQGRVLDVLGKSSMFELQAEAIRSYTSPEPNSPSPTKNNDYKPLFDKQSTTGAPEREK